MRAPVAAQPVEAIDHSHRKPPASPAHAGMSGNSGKTIGREGRPQQGVDAKWLPTLFQRGIRPPAG